MGGYPIWRVRRGLLCSRRRRHTRWPRDWSSDVCSSDLPALRGSRLLRPRAPVARCSRDRPADRRRPSCGRGWACGRGWGRGGLVKPAAAPSGHVRTRLILVRHGQTAYNREARLQGQIDIPLNVTGRRQAAVLAATVAENPPDMIISSPLSRAYDTARIVGEASGLDVHIDEAFLERGFGEWEGLKGEEIRRHWPHEHADWRAHRGVHGLDVEG